LCLKYLSKLTRYVIISFFLIVFAGTYFDRNSYKFSITYNWMLTKWKLIFVTFSFFCLFQVHVVCRYYSKFYGNEDYIFSRKKINLQLLSTIFIYSFFITYFVWFFFSFKYFIYYFNFKLASQKDLYRNL